jgi:uncharacterized pyridoxal phosphate-containing UPF0001 family protein
MLEKAPKLPQDIQWHFIGHLQTNKIKLIIGENEAYEQAAQLFNRIVFY